MTIINQWFVVLPLVDCCYKRFWKVKKKEQKAAKTDREETGGVVWESRLPLCANRLLGGVIDFCVEQKKIIERVICCGGRQWRSKYLTKLQ
jgi:ABC-type molybdate transport system permease subunit